MTAPKQPQKWHESAADVMSLLIFAALLTSPCWGLVLILWVMKR